MGRISAVTMTSNENPWLPSGIRVEMRPIALSAIGTVAPVQGVTVAADLPGLVERIAFESGRTVRKGDVLVELDTRTFRVARQFSVATGAEGPVEDHGHHAAGEMAGMGSGEAGPPHRMNPSCSPTWAEPSVDGSKVYVACNKADHILEIDVAGWAVTRQFPAGRAPYNLEATADGRLLIATLKGGAAVQFFDLATGRSLATTPSSTTVTHGVVASPDSRYAFVSVEGVGSEPGKVDIYDLRSFDRVASVEVGQQAGGIGFWWMGDLP